MVITKLRPRRSQIYIMRRTGEEGVFPSGFRLGDEVVHRAGGQKSLNGDYPVAIQLVTATGDEPAIADRAGRKIDHPFNRHSSHLPLPF